MFNTKTISKLYTPEQVADILQLSTNTVYSLIKRGEIIAKKIGKVYRISANSIFFVFSGLDADLFQKQQEDFNNLTLIEKELTQARLDL